MLTNPRDGKYIICSVGLRYIFCIITEKLIARRALGSARDVTSTITSALFNCSVFNILSSKPHPDYL